MTAPEEQVPERTAAKKAAGKKAPGGKAPGKKATTGKVPPAKATAKKQARKTDAEKSAPPKKAAAKRPAARKTGSRSGRQEPAAVPATPTADAAAPVVPPTLSATDVVAWLTGRRWYAAPTGDAPAGTPATPPRIDAVALPTDPPLALGVVTTAHGHRYQLLLDARPTPPRRPSPTGTPAASLGAPDAPDVAAEPAAAAALAGFVAAGGTADHSDVGTVSGHWLPGATEPGTGPAHVLGGEQSNTSVAVGGTHVLKLLRRLHPGVHPEVEVGRHLAAVGEPQGRRVPVAPLSGWWDLTAPDGTATTLGVVQEVVPGALDGWALVLSALAADPGGVLARLRALGEDLAALHGALARPSGDAAAEGPAAFGTEPLGTERLAAVADGLAADADRLLSVTDRPGAGHLDPARGLQGAVRAAAGDLVAAIGDDAGPAVRHHGDLHLGQTVVGPDGWVVLDFEGEPNRPLEERRRRHSPLRDVAGMLRSFAYAAATHRRAGGPRLTDGWEPAARAAFLDGYLATVDPVLLPRSAAATRNLLTLLELEKVVYEIGYELAHRPEWVVLPVEGLRRALGEVRR